ncbi:pre-mRNA processing factor 3-domain-containing protein [Massariosphaeria phaeospora]|uniref:Pre-mRNA processing factor 3-domain-containing protein n=1 Tax=Massariosphaeria phaeospora TaxID=100035 RepID=A0A7C8MNW1_9PLEO|nr:pre-mRNA processing factor 3-domain-containing protein [Massariosphaeria phaeospora]
MGEKRPYPGGNGDANGVKLAKTSAAASPAGAGNMAAAKAMALARAKEIQAKMAAKRELASKGAPAASSPAAPVLTEGTTAAAKLAAMKARIAGLGAAKSSSVGPQSSSNASTSKNVEKPSGVAPQPSRNTGTSKKLGPEGPRFATTLGNRRSEPPVAEAGPITPEFDEEGQRQNPYLDLKNLNNRDRMTRGLIFNQRGKYQDQAVKLRGQSRLEEIKNMLAKQARRAGLDENSERGFLVKPPPDVEWWDEGILEEKSYDCIDNPAKIKIESPDSIITIYVQHPVLLKAPQDKRLIETKPMYLTSKEQAKLRRMRRAADLKEHQAKIRLGLEPPPPPKVKRGNMMRVMGEQAIADPTAVEMLVESQIQQRHDNHLKANDERKLTKEERLAKLAENQKKDAQKALYMCVFKVDTLAFGKHRYQIDINAKQHDFTGVTIFHPHMNLVIVEGGSHGIQAFKKLMLHRIKWTENDKPTEIQEERQAEDPQWMKSVDVHGKLKDHSFNKCLLVFEGELKEKAFRKWGSRICETDGEAKDVLSRNKLDSLWALAKNTTE